MNENIKNLLEKVSGDEALLARFSACKTVDEAYDLASSLVGGYTKEEFVEVMTALNAANDADISDEDLAEAAGGSSSYMSTNPLNAGFFESMADAITYISKNVGDASEAASKSVIKSVTKSAKEVSKLTEEAAKSVAKSVTKVSKALAV